VNAFFDMAELKAERREPMRMKDWLETLDKFSRDFGVGVLRGKLLFHRILFAGSYTNLHPSAFNLA
jgi:hypothetical protein